jgi:LPS sulfotransferase NodH
MCRPCANSSALLRECGSAATPLFRRPEIARVLMTKVKPCFVLSMPRSGTTVFRKALATHPAIFDAGEVLNENNKRSFFHFLASLSQPPLALVTPSLRRNFFGNYIEHITDIAARNQTSASVCLVDIKYNQFHLIYDGWRDYYASPLILDFIKSNGHLIVDIHRTNTLHSVISNVFAQNTGVYHMGARVDRVDSEELSDKKVLLNKKDIMRQVANMRRWHKTVSTYFSNYDKYVCIEYENMFDSDGSRMADESLARVAKMLDLPLEFDNIPKLKKVMPVDPLDRVANKKEILAAYSVLSPP